MLVASLNSTRIEASDAEKGPEYRCPKCASIVILKKGRIVIHHFAHKPPVNCIWGKGETHQHRMAKKMFQNEFASRGLRSEVEYEISSLPNDRRADVVIWSEAGDRFAIELQHTPIDYDSLENRTQSYIQADVRVIWIPFFRPKLWKEARKLEPHKDGDFVIDRFPARPLERWVHGLCFAEIWMYDPSESTLWKGKLSKCEIYVEESSWYNEYGEEEHAGGYWKISKKWRKLTLWGPYGLNEIQLSTFDRGAKSIGGHNYPKGIIGKFLTK